MNRSLVAVDEKKGNETSETIFLLISLRTLVVDHQEEEEKLREGFFLAKDVVNERISSSLKREKSFPGTVFRQQSEKRNIALNRMML